MTFVYWDMGAYALLLLFDSGYPVFVVLPVDITELLWGTAAVNGVVAGSVFVSLPVLELNPLKLCR